uniref:Uncharacterized protein n=1 Tax=candidate division WOR-3 bacterium TaxID=2052148 RepID=A0A7V3ZSW5_UNCW3
MKVLEALNIIEEKFKSGEYQNKVKKRTKEDGKEPWIMMLDEFDIEPFELEGYYTAPWYSPEPRKTKMNFKKVEVLFRNKEYIIQIVCYEPVLSMVKIGWKKTPLFGWEFYEFKQLLKRKLKEV